VRSQASENIFLESNNASVLLSLLIGSTYSAPEREAGISGETFISHFQFLLASLTAYKKLTNAQYSNSAPRKPRTTKHNQDHYGRFDLCCHFMPCCFGGLRTVQRLLLPHELLKQKMENTSERQFWKKMLVGLLPTEHQLQYDPPPKTSKGTE
jgi:hypothetical protein